MRDLFLSTSQLTYVSDSRTFVSEASDLQGFDQASRLPLTIILISHKTGSSRVFDYELTTLSRDGDEVICWEYVHVDTYNESGGDMRLTIYND